MSAGRKRGAGQRALELELDGDGPAPEPTIKLVEVRAKVFRNERAVSEAIRAARDGTPADPKWSAAETLARELARAVDLAAHKPDPYAIAQLAPKLLEVLRELALTPASAQVKGGLDELLSDLASPD